MIGLLIIAAGAFQTGNDLFATCTSSDSALQLICAGYTSGVADEIAAIQGEIKQMVVCMPSHVTQGQVKDIAISYLRDHPEQRHYSAASLVEDALIGAFPCPK